MNSPDLLVKPQPQRPVDEPEQGLTNEITRLSEAQVRDDNALNTTPDSRERLISPLFVIGAIRSGTSLLHSLLNQHPEVSLVYECDALAMWPIAQKSRVCRDWKSRLEFMNGSLARHGIDHQEVEKFQRKGRGRAAMELYLEHAKKSGATISGEKSPAYLGRIQQIASEFPQCGFIVLWRDPKAIWASTKRASRTNRWFRRSGLYARVFADLRKALRDVRTLRSAGVPVMEVTFEELTKSTDRTMREIWRFLGLSAELIDDKSYSPEDSLIPSGSHHDAVRSGHVKKIDHQDRPLTPREDRRLEALSARLSEDYPESRFAKGGYGGQTQPASRSRHSLTIVLGKFWTNTDRFRNAVFSVVPMGLWHCYRALRG